MILRELEEFEALQRETGLTGGKLYIAWAAHGGAVLQAPPRFIPRETADQFCKRIAREVREMRRRRGVS